GEVARRLARAAVGSDHPEPLGVRSTRDDHLAAPVEPRRHPDRVPCGAAPAVDGEADEIQGEQLAELAAELEPRLVAPVVRRRRPPDRRQELRAPDDLVADGGAVVLPAAGAEEAEVLLAARVACECVAKVPSELDFGDERRRQVELAAEAV